MALWSWNLPLTQLSYSGLALYCRSGTKQPVKSLTKAGPSELTPSGSLHPLGSLRGNRETPQRACPAILIGLNPPAQSACGRGNNPRPHGPEFESQTNHSLLSKMNLWGSSSLLGEMWTITASLSEDAHEERMDHPRWSLVQVDTSGAHPRVPCPFLLRRLGASTSGSPGPEQVMSWCLMQPHTGGSKSPSAPLP